jgi:hypothetical protein
MLMYHSRGGDDTQRGLHDEPSRSSAERASMALQRFVHHS